MSIHFLKRITYKINVVIKIILLVILLLKLEYILNSIVFYKNKASAINILSLGS